MYIGHIFAKQPHFLEQSLFEQKLRPPHFKIKRPLAMPFQEIRIFHGTEDLRRRYQRLPTLNHRNLSTRRRMLKKGAIFFSWSPTYFVL
jgi:hypothetical protein